MALKEDSVSIDDPKLLAAEKLAVILGTEGDGLASATIGGCDHTVMINGPWGRFAECGGSQRGGILGVDEKIERNLIS